MNREIKPMRTGLEVISLPSHVVSDGTAPDTMSLDMEIFNPRVQSSNIALSLIDPGIHRALSDIPRRIDETQYIGLENGDDIVATSSHEEAHVNPDGINRIDSDQSFTGSIHNTYMLHKPMPHATMPMKNNRYSPGDAAPTFAVPRMIAHNLACKDPVDTNQNPFESAAYLTIEDQIPVSSNLETETSQTQKEKAAKQNSDNDDIPRRAQRISAREQ